MELCEDFWVKNSSWTAVMKLNASELIFKQIRKTGIKGRSQCAF